MKSNEISNSFINAYFTKETAKFSYIFFVQINQTEAFASFSIIVGKLPKNILSNELKKIAIFDYNRKTGDFISTIGNGKIVFEKNKAIKIVFNNFKYNNISNLELGITR